MRAFSIEGSILLRFTCPSRGKPQKVSDAVLARSSLTEQLVGRPARYSNTTDANAGLIVDPQFYFITDIRRSPMEQQVIEYQRAANMEQQGCLPLISYSRLNHTGSPTIPDDFWKTTSSSIFNRPVKNHFRASISPASFAIAPQSKPSMCPANPFLVPPPQTPSHQKIVSAPLDISSPAVDSSGSIDLPRDFHSPSLSVGYHPQHSAFSQIPDSSLGLTPAQSCKIFTRPNLLR